jgi:putative phosphoribosyl transferase
MNDVNLAIKGRSEVEIPCSNGIMGGFLTVPDGATSIIIFAHGSGSSRNSPRNNYVAKELNNKKFATLLMDLLVKNEELSISNRFNISLLKDRLKDAYIWSREMDSIKYMPVGVFGASTGSAAAIELAGDSFLPFRRDLYAVVSRGGRPDLAHKTSLEFVRAPTLFIVGGLDQQVLRMNEEAYQYLNCKKSIEIIPGASHLFEEPGTLEAAARASIKWFTDNQP